MPLVAVSRSGKASGLCPIAAMGTLTCIVRRNSSDDIDWAGVADYSAQRCPQQIVRHNVRRKAVAVGSRFLPPRSARQNSAGVFGREEPKGGKRSGVIPRTVWQTVHDGLPPVIVERHHHGVD